MYAVSRFTTAGKIGPGMDAWQAVLRRLEPKVDPQTFKTWFRPTNLARTDQQTLFIQVPNDLFRDWLEKNYSGVIESVLTENEHGPVRVEFVVNPKTPTGPAAADKEGTKASTPSTPPQTNIATPFPLNPKYTFDSFVVGSSNQFAHAAARAIAESPSLSYNPMFIYGGVGLGKTHLTHAIGNHIQRARPDLLVLYLSSERFMNELINSIRYDRTFEFRHRYRSIDVLLMDDIQFLAGKERTQEEFFHTFNALYDSQRQIVVTSDSPPKEIPTLEERLQSRFEWGLLADIQTPDLETKVAILKKKAEIEASGLLLPDDVLLYIATGSKTNIRELEGALIRLIAYGSLTGDEITLDLARRVLRDTKKASDHAITIDTIQQRVTDFYGLRGTELNSRSNARRITHPRQVAMFLCKELTRHSLPEIGRSFGGKHHSTVIHSVRKIREEMRVDEDLNREVNSLLECFQ